ncbi:LacI family DNA-binding transcriptional regulator [Cryptosporangium sp. NPDC048952]|uniref:LacI family DNA-binding transcriptional regulator n=1 Tax=Cryptosporangium sp. NPDC048952 TaxID=3363961 RepID=UPI003712A571
MMAQRQPRRTATLASLAAELGVSRTTVSNAYNRPDQLSPQLRQRVLEAAKRLGYPGPDPLARSLRTRRAGAIGLLLTEALSYAFRDPAAVEFLEGLARECEDAKTGLLLVPAVPGAGTDPALAAAAAVDGFIVYSLPNDDPHLDAALARPVPTVIVDEPLNAAGADYVGIDDRAAAAKAGAHLAELGHRNIGIICSRISSQRGPGGQVTPDRQRSSPYDVVRLRLDGLFDGLQLDRDDVPVWECWENTIDSAAAAAKEMLDAYPELTAVACTTDVLALGAVQAVRSSGRSVPDDVSVTGFDDIPEAGASGLTTVHQSHAEKGRAAWRLLSRDDRDETPTMRATIPTELRIRQSTSRLA